VQEEFKQHSASQIPQDIRQKITAVAVKFLGKCPPTSGKSRRCHIGADKLSISSISTSCIHFGACACLM
jgi:hypothetical protein